MVSVSNKLVTMKYSRQPVEAVHVFFLKTCNCNYCNWLYMADDRVEKELIFNYLKELRHHLCILKKMAKFVVISIRFNLLDPQPSSFFFVLESLGPICAFLP